MAVILPSVYKDGTATVAANGVAITGQGTMWLNTVLPGDFFGTHKGAPNRILTVNSNTSLTLAYPWLGGAQAAAAYEIMYQSDNARMQETARQLLEKLSSGNVDAFSGLVGSENRLPIFTGPGTMGTIAAGTKGRQLLASEDLLAVLTRLGPAGGYPVGPSNSEVGMSDGNFDTVIYPGSYAITGSWMGGPLSGGASTTVAGLLVVRRRTAALAGVWQTLRAGTRTWERFSSTTDGSSWGAWSTIDSPTVGSVSQSLGDPTGAIIERGSNANGEYVRFADGTQICWAGGGVSTLSSGPVNTADGAIFTGPAQVWNFPISFISSMSTVSMVTYARSAFRWGLVSGTTATVMNYRIKSATSAAAETAVDGMAIGRWF